VNIQKWWQKLVSRAPKIKSWVFVAYLIMAAFLVIDGAVYLTSPYSGRISTFTCRENESRQSEITVSIYGFKEIYQHSFLIKEVREVFRIYDFPGASSDSMVCGITIKTYSGKINFISRYQRCSRIAETLDEINEIIETSDCSPPKRIFYNGFNSSLYRRAILLVVGLLIVLIWGKSWSTVPLDKSSQAKDIKTASRRFTLSWWKTNILLKVFFYLSIFFISGHWASRSPTREGDFIGAYNLHLDPRDFGSDWLGTSVKVLFCVYPLIAFGVLQAFIQWKFLREKLPLSGWWIGAPIVASLTLVFGLPADLTSYDCSNLKFLLSSFWMLIRKSPFFWNLVIYLLIVGGIQWLVLRRKLTHSGGWIFMPLISVSLLPLINFIIWEFYFIPDILALPMYIVIPIISELIPSIYLSWVIHTKNNCYDG